MIDTDGDNRVSREEYKRQGGSDEEFDRYDTNHDGYWTVEEFGNAVMVESPIEHFDDYATTLTPSQRRLLPP